MVIWRLKFGGRSMALYWTMGLEAAALGIAMAIGNDGGFGKMAFITPRSSVTWG